MIIFFDGPDQSRKTTLAKSLSMLLKIPLWERGPYLPHHHLNTKKVDGDGTIALHNEDSLWYIIDEMKTISTFKQLGGNLIVDRHPCLSECVYRRVEGKMSPLEASPIKTSSDELVIFCHHQLSNQDIVSMYETVLKEHDYAYVDVDTSIENDALEKITQVVYQFIPRTLSPVTLVKRDRA